MDFRMNRMLLKLEYFSHLIFQLLDCTSVNQVYIHIQKVHLHSFRPILVTKIRYSPINIWYIVLRDKFKMIYTYFAIPLNYVILFVWPSQPWTFGQMVIKWFTHWLCVKCCKDIFFAMTIKGPISELFLIGFTESMLHMFEVCLCENVHFYLITHVHWRW